jgi:hypothetical protein
MKVRDFIRDKVFFQRLDKNPCLVIYDPQRRYRAIVQEMVSNKCRVIEVAETVIEPRERAIQGLQDLARGDINHLVIWIAGKSPEEPQDKIQDLFSVLSSVGRIFPEGDGDQFRSLCHRAFPTHHHDIEQLFQQGEPTFEIIDALEGGTKYPQLRALLETTSTKEILQRILVSSPRFDERLKANIGWVIEARNLISQALGHTLRTKGETRNSIANELWQVLLISEFAMDSQDTLPSSLSAVPRATPGAKALVFDLCHDLRRNLDYRKIYLENAQRIEADYKLADLCKGMQNLGRRDTFSFEEQFLFQQAVDLVAADKLANARLMAEERQESVWKTLNDDAAMRWEVLEKVIELLTEVANLPTDLGKTLEDLIDFYSKHGKTIDRCHRQVEQIVTRGLPDNLPSLETLVSKARNVYREKADSLQAEFVKRVISEGWAPSGGRFLRNNQIYDRVVKPLVDRNERVAYFLLDSLRLELGVELEKQLQERHLVERKTVWAQLPTYTEVGMASLMPEASSNLKLKKMDGTLVTHLGNDPATTPSTRFAYLASKLGDRCAQMDLDTLTGVGKPPKIAEQVRMLLVRSHELDSTAHASTASALSFLPDLLRKVSFGLGRLATMGFQKAVIATDHGFLLFPENSGGNLVAKPSGQWLVQKPRCLLGDGSGDITSLILPVTQAGIPAECKTYSVPRTLATYEKGQTYCHEGLSLQEAVLPCLVVSFKNSQTTKNEKMNLELSYRGGKTTISTRMPNLEIENKSHRDLYQSTQVEVAVEAIDPGTGKVVGEVSTGPTVNLANKCVRLEPGQKVSFTLRMEMDFEGPFKVRVFDPSTQITHAEKTLKTEYMA